MDKSSPLGGAQSATSVGNAVPGVPAAKGGSAKSGAFPAYGPAFFTGVAEMKYCFRNMKLLRNEVSFGHEVKFACIRVSELHTQSVLHSPQVYFTCRRQISLKKALAFASAFFWRLLTK